MADIARIEDTLNAALAASDKPLGATVSTDEDDLFAAMMAEADAEGDADISALMGDVA